MKEDIKKFIYPLVIVILAAVLGWVYISFVQEGVDPTVVQRDSQILNEYSKRIDKIEGLRLETDVLESDIYMSLTDEHEERVLEVSIGRVNPFNPL